MAGKSDTSHSHAWSMITGKPTTFAPSSHTHDDRYYTEAEVNEMFKWKLHAKQTNVEFQQTYPKMAKELLLIFTDTANVSASIIIDASLKIKYIIPFLNKVANDLNVKAKFSISNSPSGSFDGYVTIGQAGSTGNNLKEVTFSLYYR